MTALSQHNIKRVASYLRVSSDEQAKGHSRHATRRACGVGQSRGLGDGLRL